MKKITSQRGGDKYHIENKGETYEIFKKVKMWHKSSICFKKASCLFVLSICEQKDFPTNVYKLIKTTWKYNLNICHFNNKRERRFWLSHFRSLHVWGQMYNMITCDQSKLLLNLTLLTYECKLCKPLDFLK